LPIIRTVGCKPSLINWFSVIIWSLLPKALRLYIEALAKTIKV
jgi:hypothetical protein